MDGMQAMLAELRRIGREGPEAVKEASREQAEQLLERARQRAPRDTGALAESGRVRKTKRGYDVTFGNKDVPYAKYQHEHVGLQHKTGQAKFLEQPMAEQVPDTERSWQEAMNRVMGDA